MKFESRKYQQRILDSLEEQVKQIVVAATGAGKTVLAALSWNKFKETHRKMLFIAHTEELVNQARDEFDRFGYKTAVEMGNRKVNDDNYDILITSNASMINRYENFPKHFDFIVVDEVHHMTEDSTYDKILKYFEPKTSLGLTATFNRYDNKPISWFDKVVAEVSMLELIRTCRYCDRPISSFDCTHMKHNEWNGYLSDMKGIMIPTGTNLASVKKTKGEYQIAMLSKHVNTESRNQLVLEHYKQEVSKKSKRNLAFCVDVKHTIDMFKIFDKAGIKCAYVSGNMHIDKRRSIIKDFRDGKYQVLFNCKILIEGFNVPEVDGIMMLRPTLSGSLYSQIVGRGSRWAEGKRCCIVYDYVDVTAQHPLMTFASLCGLGKNFNPKEQSIRRLTDVTKEVVLQNPTADVSKAIDIKTLLTMAKVTNILTKELPNTYRKITNFNWFMINKGHFKLSYQGGYIELKTDVLGNWIAYDIQNKDKTVITKDVKELDRAFKTVEDYTRLHFSNQQLMIIDANADWRKKPITYKQEQMLRKFKLNFKYDISKISSGEASTIIDNFINRTKSRKKNETDIIENSYT